ncbi:hypothetical protein MN116_007877 [Schistosoma mekongi]|uniref:Protein quiver n=1 Tax=Schistosoma mekongi TaxID=38744 RepID=A0AAE1Z6V5_SCHME|nr:hypothetical protein MN116_007877 [Schistosoma mekongi]
MIPLLALILFMAYSGVCQVGIGPELRCYQCNSLTQPHCADYFDNRTFPLVACPNDGRNYSICVKMIQEMYLYGRWTRRYFRDCAVTGVIGAEDGRWCTDRSGTSRVKVRYCNCNNKNGCNSSIIASISTTIYIFMLFIFLFHIYQNLKT